jgi:hypothetical protein
MKKIPLWGDYVIAKDLSYQEAYELLGRIPKIACIHLNFRMTKAPGDSGWSVISRPIAVLRDFIWNPDAYYVELPAESELTSTSGHNK